MGIKGRRKRERERLAREAADASIDDDVSDGDMVVDDDDSDAPPLELMMGGPYAPPPMGKDGQPRMSKSQLFRLQDEAYLEQARDELKNRRNPTATRSKAAKRSRDEEEEEEVPLLHNFDSEHALQLLTAETALSHVVNKKKTASGPRFSHPLLEVRSDLVEALAKEGFMRTTKIQLRVLPLAAQGYDILGQAKTGSGKTLSFCVPILQGILTTLERSSSSKSSTLALMLAPTKELCVQTHTVLRGVCQHLLQSFKLVVQLITGGTSVTEERRVLMAGAHIVVGTPGRINDHVKHFREGWKLQLLKYLVLDEADRMLADGFQRDLDSILGATPKSRQTYLFSATNSKSVKELARLSLTKTPLFIDTKGTAPHYVQESMQEMDAPPYMAIEDIDDDADDDATHDQRRMADGKTEEEDIPSALRQFCCIVPTADRLRALYIFVKRVARSSKAMVFCSTVASTIFHCQMMGSVGFHEEVLMLHGHMKHRQRLATFEAFNQWPTGVLFCTDVAARGLDIPNVSWILQYDPPLDPTEYVHRIGRTARAGHVGNALILLTPQEAPFVKYLDNFGIHMEQYPLPEKLPRIQEKLQHVLQLDPVVAKSAVAAYRAHVGAYQSHILKETFNVRNLDLDGLVHAFALTSAPHVSLPKNAADEKKEEYIKGKLKSLNKRRAEAVKHFHRMKTKQQWTDDGRFVGVHKPSWELSE